MPAMWCNTNLIDIDICVYKIYIYIYVYIRVYIRSDRGGHRLAVVTNNIYIYIYIYSTDPLYKSAVSHVLARRAQHRRQNGIIYMICLKARPPLSLTPASPACRRPARPAAVRRLHSAFDECSSFSQLVLPAQARQPTHYGLHRQDLLQVGLQALLHHDLAHILQQVVRRHVP